MNLGMLVLLHVVEGQVLDSIFYCGTLQNMQMLLATAEP